MNTSCLRTVRTHSLVAPLHVSHFSSPYISTILFYKINFTLLFIYFQILYYIINIIYKKIHYVKKIKIIIIFT